jgi:hypothetical protein
MRREERENEKVNLERQAKSIVGNELSCTSKHRFPVLLLNFGYGSLSTDGLSLHVSMIDISV